MEKETIEEKVIKPPKKYKVAFWIVLVILIFISGLFVLSFRLISELQHKSSYEQHIKDSVLVDNSSIRGELERYKNHNALYVSMTARDNATKLLKYQVGDVVYCKPDSIPAVITDVIIGGSKYEYYLKYKVKKDLKSESFEIIPEQLY